MDDFLFRGNLTEIDPDVAALVDLEAVRQARKLIMIPSESTIPQSVREAVGSVFQNIYAEGYPPTDWRTMSEDDILDVDARFAELRRYNGKRYYQGTEVADLLESVAKRRAADLLANDLVSANKLYVNVQPLSGAPANSAVYTALIKPGDTLMGMDLLHGGHLSHGSPVARSGLQYHVVSYGVRSDTELLDYEEIMDLALEHKPKIIVAGYTSYPWAPDWSKFREIANAAGSILLADVSHVAGMIMAGVFPSPVGIVDVVMFTTHKTLAGPRGAVLVTHRADLARKIDRGVFPGEQGGPHMNNIAGLAVALKLAAKPEFKALQEQIIINAKRLAQRFTERGIRVVYGGTNSHMLVIDTGQIKGKDGTPLSGDIAARLLDLAGVVCNRNTIPGDVSPFRATGVRFGVNWLTQRGFKEAEIDALGDAIADLLLSSKAFSYSGGFDSHDWRAKVDFAVLADVQQRLHQLAQNAGIDYAIPTLDTHYIGADAAAEHFRVLPDDEPSEQWRSIEISGAAASQFLEAIVPATVYNLEFGAWQGTWILAPDGKTLAQAVVERLTQDVYLLHVSRNVDYIAQWLISLSDGYTFLAQDDVYSKIPGPVSVSVLPDAVAIQRFEGLNHSENPVAGDGFDVEKSYFIGANGALQHEAKAALPIFKWQEGDSETLLTTPLHALHLKLGAKMVPFAGYDMPVWYRSVSEEHQATRNKAGLFDVTHMGVFDVRGVGAEPFLNDVTTNDVSNLAVGEAHYSYLLDIDGIPHDDIFVYRLASDHFMVVVNASNNDKDWAWLTEIQAGGVAIDAQRGWIKANGRHEVELRDLRAESSGQDRRVDIALQGPSSRDVLLSLAGSDADKAKIKGLKWAALAQVTLGGYDLIVSRTGYTGERTAFEIFVHPDKASQLFQELIEAGAVPCGLAARDSLRTEAGLPLYGHELAGKLNLNPADAGFSGFVKLWKPFFIGKEAYIEHEASRDKVCVRFRMDHKGVRPPQTGDPVLDRRGRVIGSITSCSIDSDGYQTGLALVKVDYKAEGSALLIYSNASRSKDGKAIAALEMGDKANIPDSATVVSRFMRRK